MRAKANAYGAGKATKESRSVRRLWSCGDWKIESVSSNVALLVERFHLW